jgi:hypothetical protein
MHQDKFGIYLNLGEGRVMRVSSPYWIPAGDEWVLLTDDVNATLTAIRELVAGRRLVDDPEKVVWGDWSQVPPPV